MVGKFPLSMAVLFGIAAAPGTAMAAQANANMNISANVQSACIVSATDMAFGNYSPVAATATDMTSSIVVTCTTGTSYTVALNQGGRSGATVTTRQMASGANVLNYSLYRDAGRTANWGNTPGTDTPTATVATTSPSNFTVYGRIPALQNVPTGNYADVVTVTVTY